jgi:DNA-3-methyladenine glycosylase II
MNLKWNSKMLAAFYEIKKIDQNFKKIFDEFGLPENRATEKNFESIVRIIIGQQISTNVAKKIYEKLSRNHMLNEKVLSTSNIEELKSFGLSTQKSIYIKNLAILSLNKKLDVSSLDQLSSKEVTDVLLPIKGIGQWTINNFKIFALQDVNAWPSADLALQEAVKILLNLNKRPNQIEMENLSQNWEPYRGAAAFFLWHFYNKSKIKSPKS